MALVDEKAFFGPMVPNVPEVRFKAFRLRIHHSQGVNLSNVPEVHLKAFQSRIHHGQGVNV